MDNYDYYGWAVVSVYCYPRPRVTWKQISAMVLWINKPRMMLMVAPITSHPAGPCRSIYRRRSGEHGQKREKWKNKNNN